MAKNKENNKPELFTNRSKVIITLESGKYNEKWWENHGREDKQQQEESDDNAEA